MVVMLACRKSARLQAVTVAHVVAASNKHTCVVAVIKTFDTDTTTRDHWAGHHGAGFIK